MVVYRLEYGSSTGMQTASQMLDALFYYYLEAGDYEGASALQNRLSSLAGTGFLDVTPGGSA